MGITYAHRRIFFLAIALVTAGVALHLPMYFRAADMGYHLNGMGMGTGMVVGMAAILAGFGLAVYALVPAGRPPAQDAAMRVRFATLDDAPITRQHVILLVVLALAVTIDVMKPVTLGFVAPGVAREYGLKSPANPGGSTPVALLPLFGISGTVVGSILWGWLGDRIGRRASILLAGVVFVGTAICGAMPDFEWNLVMCFIMGLGVGGMLPITFALIAETMPTRHRGWLLLLLGGDVAGGYVLTSWLSAELTPTYGWRVLWLLGLPTGLLLLALNRWIPESPRYLIAQGRGAEARQVLRRYGVFATDELPDADPRPPRPDEDGGFRDLVRGSLRSPTAIILLFAVAVGLVTYGFQLWIPSNLGALGFDEVTSDKILRDSALLGFPVTIVTAVLYGFWSSRGTLLLLGTVTVGALAAFAIGGDDLVHHPTLLRLLLVVPTTGISSVLAAVIAYGSELYPTRLRGRGAGLAAGASKAGGVLVIAVVVAALTAPSIATTALIGLVPMALAVLAIALRGRETRQIALETLSEPERHPVVAPG
jgi:putative MFS transporter